MEPSSRNEAERRTVLIIDGSYARIGALRLRPGGRIGYIKLREELERLADGKFRECWYFDQEPTRNNSVNQGLSTHYTSLKRAPPQGPQFQLQLYSMKKYQCHCRNCGIDFTQNVQKGVDNGIATKILSLAYENICDRFVLLAGDGDFYDSLNLVKNILRKELWVVGYHNTLSADLQQLANRVVWIDELWDSVQLTDPRAQESEPQPVFTSHPLSRDTDRRISPQYESMSNMPPLRQRGGRGKGERHVQVTVRRPTPRRNNKSPTRRRREQATRETNGRAIADNSCSSPRANAKSPTRRRREQATRVPDGHTITENTWRPQASSIVQHNIQQSNENLFFIDRSPDKDAVTTLLNAGFRRPEFETSEGRRRVNTCIDGPPSKRSRQDMTLELSDLSSDDDDDLKRPVQSITTQHYDNGVIDLASDSDC